MHYLLSFGYHIIIIVAVDNRDNQAEWSTRTVHKLMLHVENVSSKMRNAGLCEMICSAVQRQAISSAVSG